MSLNELITELQVWQENGLGELPVFIRQYDNIMEESSYWDASINNWELTQVDNKLIFL